MLEIRDPESPGPDASLEEQRGRRLAALQAALLKHADDTGVRSLMTFHSRTLDAMAFARALPETAAELYETDPVTYPNRVGAEWLCGEHPAAHRRAVLDRFGDGLDAEGWVTDMGILASCQVLGEGVDIRGKRGVNAVVFADTRSSPVQIVQITGRGLRQEPGEGKVARLIVPIFLQPGEDPEDMMASASYRPLVAVLQGLRAHDDRILERMALRTSTSSGHATSVVALDPQQEDTGEDEEEEAAAEGADDSVDAAADGVGEDLEESDGGREADGGPEERGEREPEGAGVPLLRFSLPRNPDVIAAFLRTRVLRPDSEVWLSGFNALRKWVQAHGDAQVPLDAVVPVSATESDGGDGDGGTYALGAWVSEQRRQFRLGTLKAWRAELLDELGMVWSVTDARFYKNLAAARVYFAVHGTLAAPKDAVVDGVPVGQWLANLRKSGGLGKDETRAAERRTALESIDPDWNPEWPIDWQRRYAALASMLADQATLAELLPGVTFDDQDIGAWLTAQRERWEQLSDGQRERLVQLGVEPLPPEPETPAKTSKTALGPFERGIAALTQYKSPHRLREAPQGPRRAAGGRDPGQTRRISVEHQSQARQTHPRQAHRPGGTGS